MSKNKDFSSFAASYVSPELKVVPLRMKSRILTGSDQYFLFNNFNNDGESELDF